MDDQNKNEQQGNSEGVSRRDVIKGLATIPVLGGVIYSAYRKMKYDPAAACMRIVSPFFTR